MKIKRFKINMSFKINTGQISLLVSILWHIGIRTCKAYKLQSMHYLVQSPCCLTELLYSKRTLHGNVIKEKILHDKNL